MPLNNVKTYKRFIIWLMGSFVLSLLVAGCTEPKIITQKIYVPIKCDISMPQKPTILHIHSGIQHVINLAKNEVIYRVELENALRFCIGEANSGRE